MLKLSKNTKFFVNIVAIIVLLNIPISLYVASFSLNYNSPNNTRWWLINKTLDKAYNLQDTTIKILFLGDSRPNAGIDFRRIKKSWSFCVGGTSPIENYYMLKKYLAVYEKPETLFLSISPRFLTSQFSFWDLAVRNHFFSEEEFKEIYAINLKLDDTLLYGTSKIKFFLNEMCLVKYYQEDLRKNLLFFAKNDNKELIKYIMENRGRRPHPNLQDSCSDLNFEVSMTKFEMSPIYEYYFNKIFETCTEKNIYCSFFSMPMNESSFNRLDVNFIADYKITINDFQQKYPQFSISDTLYYYKDDYFGDKSHLNTSGEEIFTYFFINKYMCEDF